MAKRKGRAGGETPDPDFERKRLNPPGGPKARKGSKLRRIATIGALLAVPAFGLAVSHLPQLKRPPREQQAAAVASSGAPEDPRLVRSRKLNTFVKSIGDDLAQHDKSLTLDSLRALAARHPRAPTLDRVREHEGFVAELSKDPQIQASAEYRSTVKRYRRDLDAVRLLMDRIHGGLDAHERVKDPTLARRFSQWLNGNWRDIHQTLSAHRFEQGGVIRRTPDGFRLVPIDDPGDRKFEQLIERVRKNPSDLETADELYDQVKEHGTPMLGPDFGQLMDTMKTTHHALFDLPVDPKDADSLAPQAAKGINKLMNTISDVIDRFDYDPRDAVARLGDKDVIGIFHHHPGSENETEPSPPSDADLRLHSLVPGHVFSLHGDRMKVFELRLGKAREIASFER